MPLPDALATMAAVAAAPASGCDPRPAVAKAARAPQHARIDSLGVAMKRRDFLQAGSAVAAAGALAACAREGAPAAAGSADSRRFEWKMVTTWPANFPALGTGASRLAAMIGAASGGRLTVKVYGGGELVPAFETFDAVSRGTAQMGHGAAYYWGGKSPACPFFAAVPFGMNTQEMNGWLYHGGGLALWRELYAGFGLVPFPAGNTGVQMAGWFNREIRSVEDLRGLKMRIPGLGGEVMARLGAAPVNLPGAELFTALQTGAIDATEWVGPYNDLAFGLFRAAKYYYYPGWHEPCATLECIVNKAAHDELPDDLKAIVDACCRAVNDDVLAELTAQNGRALEQLRDEHQVDIRPLPDSVLAALKTTSDQVIGEVAARDPFAQRVLESYRAFQANAAGWHAVSELPFFLARG
jgi:TRAP-type mannitol/chloroaromatic compound transport system substrate-binding protein